MYDTLVTLKKGAGRTLKAGGMWVYDNEIESIAGDFENGDIVTIHDFDGFFLGTGFINTRSKLTVRLLSRKKGTVIDDAFLEKLEHALSASQNWVLDGNYNRTRPVKWRNVDLVVWVDYGFVRTLYQAVIRAIKRAWHQHELWPGTGNKESFRRAFFSRESIIIWTIKTWRNNRRRYQVDMQNPDYAHIRFIRITRRAQAEMLISSLKSYS